MFLHGFLPSLFEGATVTLAVALSSLGVAATLGLAGALAKLSRSRVARGVAGVYTRDIAETKLKATERLAEQHEFPLLVTMEPEGDREGHT